MNAEQLKYPVNGGQGGSGLAFNSAPTAVDKGTQLGIPANDWGWVIPPTFIYHHEYTSLTTLTMTTQQSGSINVSTHTH